MKCAVQSIGCKKKGFGVGATKPAALPSSLQIIFSKKYLFGFLKRQLYRSIILELLCLSRPIRVSAKSEGVSWYT